MRKRKLTLQDLGRVPVTVVASEGRPSLKKFTAEYNREQDAAEARRKAEQERPFIEAQNEFNKNLAALRKEQASTIFDRPSDELRSRCSERPAEIDGTAAEISKAILTAARSAFAGINLTESGRDKIVRAMKANPTIDPMKSENWKATYDYLTELRVFIDEDGVSVVEQPQLVAQPQSVQTEPTFDEVLNSHSIELRSGQKVIAEAVRKEVRKDNYTAWYEFADEVKTLFFDNPTKDEAEALLRVMNARNLNKASARDWHTARVLAVRAGFLRDKFLLPDEVLSWQMDKDEVPLNTFADRQAFNRRVAAIHKGIPVLS